MLPDELICPWKNSGALTWLLCSRNEIAPPVVICPVKFPLPCRFPVMSACPLIFGLFWLIRERVRFPWVAGLVI